MEKLRYAFMTAVCLSALFFSSATAFAVPVTFQFTGTVTQTNFDPSDPFGGTIAFGTAVTGSYIFDSSTIDSVVGPTTGSYLHTGVPYGLSVTLGGNNFATNDYLAVNVVNGATDQYGVLACAGGSGACFSGGFTFSMLLQDPTGTALSSDALPLVAPSVASFQSRTFSLYRTYEDQGGNLFQIQIDGTINTLTSSSRAPVPEPSTAASVLLGCLVLAAVRLKTRSGKLI